VSQQMTITRVMEGDEWGNDYGRNQSYTLDLQLEDGSVVQDIVSNRKIRDGTHKEPQENEVVWGDLLPMGKNQRKLKLDYDAMKEHGSGSSPRSSRPSESSTGTKSSEVDWDAKEARITRQAVLKVLSPSINEHGGLTASIKATVEEIEQFVSEAPSRPLGQGVSQGQPPSTFPSDSGSPAASGSPPADDSHEWMENLLIQGGASSYAAGRLASFAIEELSPENLKKCEGLLSNLDSQVEGRKRLETSYTKAKGEPVPQMDPHEDDIPF
jgi:hypothetical protein